MPMPNYHNLGTCLKAYTEEKPSMVVIFVVHCNTAVHLRNVFMVAQAYCKNFQTFTRMVKLASVVP